MNNQLTVIIPFLNEGIEVKRTIQEIKRTARDEVDVILVNDASDDGYDYESLVRQYKTDYIIHRTRKGSGPAKQAGINACKTPYFLVIDGHMRFYDNNWWNEIIAAIENDPRAIYCCRCKAWDFETGIEKNTEAGYGSYLRYFLPENKKVFELKWVLKDIFPEGSLVDIPCVLGACYAASKEYWNHLRGFDGLKLYSCEEAYISMKTWMEGGRCRLLKNIQIGHLFRKNFPYKVIYTEFFYNKLLMADLLLTADLQRKMIRTMKAIDYVEYVRSRNQMEENREEIEALRAHYSKILTAGFGRFEQINSRFEAIKDISQSNPAKSGKQ